MYGVIVPVVDHMLVVMEYFKFLREATMLSIIVVYRESIAVFVKYLRNGILYCGSSFNNISRDYH